MDLGFPQMHVREYIKKRWASYNADEGQRRSNIEVFIRLDQLVEEMLAFIQYEAYFQDGGAVSPNNAAPLVLDQNDESRNEANNNVVVPPEPQAAEVVANNEAEQPHVPLVENLAPVLEQPANPIPAEPIVPALAGNIDVRASAETSTVQQVSSPESSTHNSAQLNEESQSGTTTKQQTTGETPCSPTLCSKLQDNMCVVCCSATVNRYMPYLYLLFLVFKLTTLQRFFPLWTHGIMP